MRAAKLTPLFTHVNVGSQYMTKMFFQGFTEEIAVAEGCVFIVVPRPFNAYLPFLLIVNRGFDINAYDALNGIQRLV